MATISAHDIFKQVKDEIFNLKSKGEMEIPILHNEFHVPTEDDMLKAYWQDENNITVTFKGQKRLIPCQINTTNDEYVARCIMQGFAQICLNKNESKEQKTISKKDAIGVMENTISRLVNEGIMEVDDNFDNEQEEEEEKEYHFIWENNKIVLMLLNSIASEYDEYSTCDIDKYDAWVEFGSGIYIIVSMDDDGYIYVSNIESTTIDSKQESTKVWQQVGDCINKINNLKQRPCDLHFGGRRYSFESKLHEGRGFKNNQNYSHFAVNKNTGKIVNGWDYKGYDPSELRQFRKDYFINDLVEYGFNPSEYKILTGKMLKKMGTDPDDNSNWTNN